MLNIVMALLISAVPTRRVLSIDKPYKYEFSAVKLDTTDMNFVGQTDITGDGWRAYIMSGESNNNIQVVGKDTLIVIWTPWSGDSSLYFGGCKVSYSFDGGATWTHYDLTTDKFIRFYPDIYFDKSTGTPWFVWQQRPSPSGDYSYIYVAYDAFFPNGLFTTIQIPDTTKYYYCPSIVAHGDTVLVVGDDFGSGVFYVWRSTDKGQTWAVVDSGNFSHDTPKLFYDEVNNKVYMVALNEYPVYTRMFVKTSDDFGATWSDTVWTTLPLVEEYGFHTWWPEISGAVANGKLHIITSMNWGAVYDVVWDGTTWSYTHLYGDVYQVIDTTVDTVIDTTVTPPDTSIDTTIDTSYVVWPEGWAPTISVDEYGNIFAFFWTYDVDTAGNLTWLDPVVMASFDGGATWTAPEQVFPYADVLDESYSEIAPTALYDPATGSYTFYMFGGIWDYGNSNLYEYTFTWTPVGVSERNTGKVVFNVRPTIVTGKTTVEFTLPTASNVEISLYNVAGQKVSTVYSGHLNAGYHTIPVKVDGLKGGVYFLNLKAGNTSTSAKIVVK